MVGRFCVVRSAFMGPEHSNPRACAPNSAFYVQAPCTERTDDTPDVAGTKKIDLSSCAFPHDGDWFYEVADPKFLWRRALAFSPRGLDHAKRRRRDRVAPYFFVTVYIHYMKMICYLPLKVTLLLHPMISKSPPSLRPPSRVGLNYYYYS